jgi:hypothetical protein
VRDLVAGWQESSIRGVDLTRMGAGFSGETQAPGGLRFAPEAIEIGNMGIGTVEYVDPRLPHRKTQRHLYLLHRCRVVSVDTQRFEQVAETQLQSGDARVSRGDLIRPAKSRRCLDVHQQSESLGSRNVQRIQRGGSLANIIAGHRHRQVDHVRAARRDGSDIGFEMCGRHCIDPHDQNLGTSPREIACKEPGEFLARCGLSVLDDSIFQIERQRVRFAGKCFLKELWAGSREEQFAAHDAPS